MSSRHKFVYSNPSTPSEDEFYDNNNQTGKFTESNQGQKSVEPNRTPTENIKKTHRKFLVFPNVRYLLNNHKIHF